MSGEQTTITMSDGAVYAGEVGADGRANGQGVYTFADGIQISGEFRDGLPNGLGVETWPDGRRFEGKYRNGERNGSSVFSWPDGMRFEGEWRGGMFVPRGACRRMAIGPESRVSESRRE